MKKLLLVLLLSLAASFGFAQTRQAGTVAVVNSDFWRSTAGALPDGVIDTTEAIVHNGQVVIDTGSAADSGLTLPQLTTTVAPTVGAAAIGVTATGKVVRYTAPAFDSTVDFSTATPTSAGVVFTPNTPALTTVLYVSAVNGSQWTYNGTAYVSASVLPSWQTTGNAGTVEANNFIGTTDNVGFSFLRARLR